jgi:hypothetical protein
MGAVLVVVAAFGLVTALLAWTRWLAGRRRAALGHLALAAFAAAVVTTSWPLTTYLAAYEPHLRNQPVAELHFQRRGVNRYQATVTRLPGGRMQVVELVGDQWRLGVETLEWSEDADRLGARPRFRVERLASRLAATAEGDQPTKSEHDLRGASRPPPWLAGLGAWRDAPLLTARRLESSWQPLADGARFDVRVADRDVLAVEPVNAAAGESLAAR